MPLELWPGILAGGFALLGAAAGAGLTYLTNRDNRKATVRDQAHRHAIDTCTGFVGVSFIFISRKHDIVSSLARLKQIHPDAARLGRFLDDDLLKTVVHPVVEQFYTLCVRAESAAPTNEAAEHIHKMAVVHSAIGQLMSDGMAGQLPADWKAQAAACIRDHDEAANQLIRHLRDFEATATYRKRITFTPDGRELVDAPAENVQH